MKLELKNNQADPCPLSESGEWKLQESKDGKHDLMYNICVYPECFGDLIEVESLFIVSNSVEAKVGDHNLLIFFVTQVACILTRALVLPAHPWLP